MHDHLRPSLLRTVIVTAVLVVMAGLIWPHIAQWYYNVIATLADSFSPTDVSITPAATTIAISHMESDGTFFIKGMVLGLGSILPTVVAATTPTMQISSRSISVLAVGDY